MTRFSDNKSISLLYEIEYLIIIKYYKSKSCMIKKTNYDARYLYYIYPNSSQLLANLILNLSIGLIQYNIYFK